MFAIIFGSIPARPPRPAVVALKPRQTSALPLRWTALLAFVGVTGGGYGYSGAVQRRKIDRRPQPDSQERSPVPTVVIDQLENTRLLRDRWPRRHASRKRNTVLSWYLI